MKMQMSKCPGSNPGVSPKVKKIMKTLVIHPFDVTTGFLTVIYERHRDWTIIDTNVSSRFLQIQIEKHNRIVMLGHGDANGLYGYNRMIIDSDFVYLLREKECVCIWCNANIFVEKYKLKGFYTGMIISDYEEALMYAINPVDNDIYNSNVLFAEAVRRSIDGDDMVDDIRSYYKDASNAIIEFNKDNLYYEDTN